MKTPRGQSGGKSETDLPGELTPEELAARIAERARFDPEVQFYREHFKLVAPDSLLLTAPRRSEKDRELRAQNFMKRVDEILADPSGFPTIVTDGEARNAKEDEDTPLPSVDTLVVVKKITKRGRHTPHPEWFRVEPSPSKRRETERPQADDPRPRRRGRRLKFEGKWYSAARIEHAVLLGWLEEEIVPWNYDGPDCRMSNLTTREFRNTYSQRTARRAGSKGAVVRKGKGKELRFRVGEVRSGEWIDWIHADFATPRLAELFLSGVTPPPPGKYLTTDDGMIQEAIDRWTASVIDADYTSGAPVPPFSDFAKLHAT